MIVLTDCFDPRKGSEFQVPCKFIRELSRNTTIKAIEVWCLERADNSNNIKKWISESNLSCDVQVKVVKSRFTKDGTNHSSKFMFFLDLMRLYAQCYKKSDPNHPIFKIGLVSFLFNFIAVFSKRISLIGPISGFEKPECLAMIKSGFSKLAIKYFAIYVLSKVYLTVVFFRVFVLRWKTTFILATQNDYEAFQKISSKKFISLGCFKVSEVDLDGNNDHLKSDHGIGCEEKINILWSGHLIDRKNPMLALEVLKVLDKNYPSLNLAMIGSGPLQHKLISGLKEPGCGIKFFPEMPASSFRRVVENSSCVFISSWREVNSVFVFEVLSAGKQILCPRVSGMKEVLYSYTDNLYEIGCQDPDELAKKLYSLVCNDKSLPGPKILNELCKKENSQMIGAFEYALT